MNPKKILAALACVALSVGAFAADKLAVAEPVGKGGVPASDIEAFWSILETGIHSDEYTLISRGALNQILTEIGLTNSSDLVNLNSSQKAKLGQIEGVKYILVTEVSKFGSRLNCTMRIVDTSTGEIDQARTANLRVQDLDELADKIEDTLKTLLSDDKALHRSAILAPVVTVPAPAYLAEDFNVRLENSMLEKGLKLQNLKSVSDILAKNNISNLYGLEPKMFTKIGGLLQVEMLIQATITRFEIRQIAYNVAETGARGFRYIGYLEGSIHIISAQTGEMLCSVPFDERVNFRDLPVSMTRDWTADDYGKYLIKTVIPQIVVPGIMKSPAFKDLNPAPAKAEEPAPANPGTAAPANPGNPATGRPEKPGRRAGTPPQMPMNIPPANPPKSADPEADVQILNDVKD